MLPKELRAALADESFAFDAVEPVVVQHSSDKQTIKGLFRLHDGNEVESVLMQHSGERNTVRIEPVRMRLRVRVLFDRPGRLHAASDRDGDFNQARYFARHLAAQGRR